MDTYLTPQTTGAYLILALVILLPIIPSFLLFKALPAGADLGGLFQGMDLKLSGAFAAYFALVLLILSTHSIWNPPVYYQVWQVSGTVTDEGGNAIQPLDPQDVSLQPPSFQPQLAGAFKLSFSTIPGQGNSEDYPVLMVGHKDYTAVNIDLDPASGDTSSNIKWDKEHHKIKITRLILRRNSPYNPTVIPIAQAPVPLH
jgi:hypothetical protein